MKLGSLFFGAVAAFVLTGCGAKPYVDTDAKEYATFQIVPHSETLIFTDDYYALIDDYSKGCSESKTLGIVETDSDTPSRVVKLPVGKPMLIGVYYKIEALDNSSSYTEYTKYVLTPRKDKHYVVSYVRKDLSFFETMSDFDIYMEEGDKKVDVPASDVREFDWATECKKD